MTDQATLNQLPDSPTVVDRPAAEIDAESAELDAELLMFIQEAQRLFDEAETRLRCGEVLPALSSLAAVPPLHGMLMGRCSAMLEPEVDESPEPQTGLYL